MIVSFISIRALRHRLNSSPTSKIISNIHSTFEMLAYTQYRTHYSQTNIGLYGYHTTRQTVASQRIAK
ncbi:MAG: hypothetical protein ACI8VC_002554 [Candidatus Endobugula sp.]|jgi:hypothetical protein